MKLTLTAGFAFLVGATHCKPSLPLVIETRSALRSRLANIHIERLIPVNELVDFTYGPCDSTSTVEAHHTVGQITAPTHDRVVWVIPDTSSSRGCISAWSNATGILLGRSKAQHFGFKTPDQRQNPDSVRRRNNLHAIRMGNTTGIDVWGAWFDGVELLKNTEVGPIEAAAAKRKNIAIIGAGMAGLMTYLCLVQQGMTNVSILEAGDRLGGRVRTVYLSGGPFDYSYQEMGPMRLPTTLTVDGQIYNMSDHQLVFELADEMNRLNNHNSSLSVDFIPWYEASDNRPHPGGQSGMEKLFDKVNKALPCKDFCVEMARNMFKAHQEWLDNGLRDLPKEPWSEFAYTVGYVTANFKPGGQEFQSMGGGASSFWDKLCETVYLNATTWKTIDGGMDRLPLSFSAFVENATTMHRRVEGVWYSPGSDTVTLQSNSHDVDTPTNSTHDYAVLAVPFSVMKTWQIPGLGATMQDAIANLPYTSACKVALEFKTRFWEHFPKPIYGSCWTASPEFPGIGTMCYPSYNINGTGPAALLASYISDPAWGAHWAATSESEHVQYVLDAMVGIHGEIARQQYTGKHSRMCWALDPLEGASWADPTVEQHQVYLPEYFKTHNNMIFVGEHTSYTHAWIASALESGIRGSVQLLLELGLVDEAKATVEKWMARWIQV
ncbi:L-amino acid oxidase [Lasiosphaeris hirsuta]|uniref:L-amino acid oxidase n=1 Tax=Lasiosphaeris hirsuta TaxID=260670 RepID=A0AA40AQN3_9PEZI|nr:L-amino acid oxidase [Lasiosphaeris hirsuta]